MSWRVGLARDAKKELARLPAAVQNRDGWRVRVGEYRILYFADKPARQIIVGVIAHRKDVYRK